MKKILFVVTSHDKKGDTGEPTGYYLAEATHPWQVLVEAGYEIDFASPKGGKAPVDGFDLEDAVNKRFWEDEKYRGKIENTMKPSKVNADDYNGIFYVGGQGTMWDFAENTELPVIAQRIYEKGGIVSAVCHGPSGLLNIKLSNGDYLIKDKKICSFTNAEEVAVGTEKVVPYLLEDAIVERGAVFVRRAPWGNCVMTDNRVITGQNPQSAHSVGEAILKALKSL